MKNKLFEQSLNAKKTNDGSVIINGYKYRLEILKPLMGWIKVNIDEILPTNEGGWKITASKMGATKTDIVPNDSIMHITKNLGQDKIVLGDKKEKRLIKESNAKQIVKLTEQDLTKIIGKILSEQDYMSDIERSTQPREKQIKDVFGKKYGRYIPNDVIRYMRKNPREIFARLYDIYGDMAYTYLDKAKNKESITESDDHNRTDRYMFFSNLEQMHRQCELLLDIDQNEIETILDNGHDWAQDHIAEAKNNMDQVFDFIMNETNEPQDMEDDFLMEGELSEKKKKNTATNQKLWQQSLAWARSRYKVCPSAYCNGAAVKRYNSKGGKWKKK
jgi:uncharacterized protein YbcI